MRRFWGLYSNGRYQIGCNGATMYLHDKDGVELAKFKDIPYAYAGAFKPDTNIFVLRSTAGLLAVYDLDERELIRKFRFSSIDAAQDDGYCFSEDGKLFFNIERHTTTCRTRLSVYETERFTAIHRFFEEDDKLVLQHIESDKGQEGREVYFTLGFTRGRDKGYGQGFIAALVNGELTNQRSITEAEHHFLNCYKTLQLRGFTERSAEWSGLRYTGYSDEQIAALKNQQLRLSTFTHGCENV